MFYCVCGFCWGLWCCDVGIVMFVWWIFGGYLCVLGVVGGWLVGYVGWWWVVGYGGLVDFWSVVLLWFWWCVWCGCVLLWWCEIWCGWVGVCVYGCDCVGVVWCWVCWVYLVYVVCDWDWLFGRGVCVLLDWIGGLCVGG